MSKRVDRPLWISAIHVETTDDGAVFKIEVGADGEDIQERHREALNIVDAFCQSYFDDQSPGPDSGDLNLLGDWPCDEYGIMPFKYKSLGGDWSNLGIIIAERYLAACFKRDFCPRDREPEMRKW